MSVRHKFFSQKTDAPDSTLVRPVDWNDTHLGSPDILQTTVRNVTGGAAGQYVLSPSITGDCTVLVTVSGGGATGANGFSVILPSASGNVGRVYTIKKVDNGDGYVVVDASGDDAIDGQATWWLSNPYQFVVVQSDGRANWYVVGGN